MNLSQHPALLLALIGLLGVAAQWCAWRLKLPAILFLLLIGLLLGPATEVLRPDELLGDLLFPLVSLGVAVILFEGSLTLRFFQIRGLEGAVRNLVTLGVFINWLIMGLAAGYLLSFSWDLALLFAALVTVTGPTVITPMLRSVRPTARIAQVLRWEGIIIDPIGALFAVLVFEFIVSGQEEATLLVFAEIVGVGVAFGVLGGWLLAVVLRRRWLPDYLHDVATLALVLCVFTVADALEHESGLLAVTVMGIWLANAKNVHVDDILNFKESLSIFFISGLFILLAARVELAQFSVLGLNALAVLAVIMFLARPAAVFLSTLGAELNWREKTLIAWIGPRGIVAAAVTPLFVVKLQQYDYPHTDLLAPLTFMVIMGTVALQSLTARPLANWLGVSEPTPRGVLIAGANPVARAVAKALKTQDFPVKVADTSWQRIKTARMEGLDAYYGNLVSEHADRHLELVGIGRLLAMTPHPALNALACLRYKAEFGSDAVFSLKTQIEDEASDTHAYAVQDRWPWLFSETLTYTRLADLLNNGGRVRATPLTEDFDYQDYRERYGDEAIGLFAVDPSGNLHVFTTEHAPQPKPGWTIISLLPTVVSERS